MAVADRFVLDVISSRARPAPSGWLRVDCPMCVSQGEPRPDRRQRGGFLVADGEAVYTCLRCRYRAHWQDGRPISTAMRQLLLAFGASEEEIDRASFESWSLDRDHACAHATDRRADPVTTFEPITIPRSWIRLRDLDPADIDPKFLEALTLWLRERSHCLVPSLLADAMVDTSGELGTRVIFPLRVGGVVVGWTARDVLPDSRVRWLSRRPPGVLWNHDRLYRRPYWILATEGVFDAALVDGVAWLGQRPTAQQLRFLLEEGVRERVVFVPDRDRAGLAAVEVALAHGFRVAVPWSRSAPVRGAWWPENAKDIADACRRLHPAAVAALLLRDATDNPAEIRLRSNAACMAGTERRVHQ